MAKKSARPPRVQAAVLRGDRAACSEFGKRGAKKRAEIKAEEIKEKEEDQLVEDVFKKIRADELLKAFARRDRQANLDVCPID